MFIISLILGIGIAEKSFWIKYTVNVLSSSFCLFSKSTCPSLGLSQYMYRTFANLFENFSMTSLKRDLSNDSTVNPLLFSLVNTFNIYIIHLFREIIESVFVTARIHQKFFDKNIALISLSP